MSGPLPIEPFLTWLAFGERGVSSETIVAHLTGRTDVRKTGWTSEPYDAGDFRRCERLLRQVPIARLAFPSMRSLSPAWAALVDAWDEIVALMEEQVPGVFDSAAHGSAPRACARIAELRELSRAAVSS